MMKGKRAGLLGRGRLSELRMGTVMSQPVVAEFKPPLATTSKKCCGCASAGLRIQVT